MEIFVILILGSVFLSVQSLSKECSKEPEDGFFYYFAYGSNMLPDRIHINCKSATNVSTAKLENYRLDFNMSVSRWAGAVATIVEDDSSTVWGVVWRISMLDSPKLDKQEGVQSGWYHTKDVKVGLKCGPTVTARVYISCHQPQEKVPPEDLPPERQPSRTYHQVILLGALRNHLPAGYLNYLSSFPNNGRLAPSATRKNLGYPFYDATLA